MNHRNIHVPGYKEEGTVTTALAMSVLNDLDCFHVVISAPTASRRSASGGRR